MTINGVQQLALPTAPKTLALPAMSILPQTKREEPIKFVYQGFPLWITFEQKDGFWAKIVVSVRKEDNLSKRSIRPYGQTLCSLRYTPKGKKLPIGKQIPAEVIEATLDKVMPTRFLPKLFDACPEIKTSDLTFGLVAPFALARLHKVMGYEESTEKNQVRTLVRMIDLWRALSVKEITPEKCAPDLLAMDVAPMEESIRLLRRLFEIELGALVENPRIWHEYHLPQRGKPYSPTRAIQKVTLNKPATSGQLAALIDICEKNLRDPKEGAAYLAALTILTERITVEECCALLAGSLKSLDGYEDYYGLDVHQFIETQGERSRGDGHVRDHRHVVQNYAFDAPERRRLGVSPRLARAWQAYRESHSDVSDNDRLLRDPRNSQRVWAPEGYQEWLNETFGPLFPKRSVALQGKTITETRNIEGLFQATAREQMMDYGRFAAEEFRYHSGQEPLAMDALHYAGFDAPTELVTMGLMQERSIRSVKGYCPEELQKNSSKLFGVPGKPHEITMMRFRIKIPATEQASDVIVRLSAEMGFNASFKIEKEENWIGEKTSKSGNMEAAGRQTGK